MLLIRRVFQPCCLLLGDKERMGIGHSSESSAETDETVIRLRRKDVPWLRSEEPMTEAIIDPARQEALDNQMVEFTARDYKQAKEAWENTRRQSERAMEVALKEAHALGISTDESANVVFVWSLNQSCCILPFEPSTLIEDFREQIAQRLSKRDLTGCTAQQIRLLYAGMQIEDGRTFADYNIQKHSALACVLRLRATVPDNLVE